MRDHRSIIAWQEARTASLGVFALAKHDWKPWCSALFSQMQRAALSVQLNIAEGYAYGPGRRQTHHLQIAYGSAIETGELLELARDAEAVPAATIDTLLCRNQRCQRLLLGMLKQHRPF